LQKRGQVTLFIIIGIVILLSVGVFIFIQTSEGDLTPEIIPLISEVPSEFRPVRIFTEECMSAIAEEAFKKIGDRGGYVDPDNFGISSNSFDPTNADSIEFSPESGLKIPYWWHMRSNNKCAGDCTFTTLKPELYGKRGNAVEKQAADYLNEQLPICLNEYLPFTAQGIEFGDFGVLDTTVLIGETDISVFIDYPFTVSSAGAVHDFDKFFITLPLNFKRIYELAEEITEVQIKYHFLENQILNVISAYSNVDADSLPPMAESEFDFAGGTFWSEIETKRRIESILTPYVSAIQIPFTISSSNILLPSKNCIFLIPEQVVKSFSLKATSFTVYATETFCPD